MGSKLFTAAVGSESYATSLALLALPQAHSPNTSLGQFSVSWARPKRAEGVEARMINERMNKKSGAGCALAGYPDAACLLVKGISVV